MLFSCKNNKNKLNVVYHLISFYLNNVTLVNIILKFTCLPLSVFNSSCFLLWHFTRELFLFSQFNNSSNGVFRFILIFASYSILCTMFDFVSEYT